jgi:recombination protein RecT
MNAIARTPATVFKAELTARRPNFMATLPNHIPIERFERTCLVAVQRNPDLLKANPDSLLLSCQRAAQDGLLPDGREGAIVVFGGQAQWMPMVAGLMKLARNSGEIASITAHVAYKGEKFLVILGDEERIEHERSLDLADDAQPIAVYAVAKLKNGETVREIMTTKQVEKVRNVSRAKGNGPWVQWWDEMAKKTAIRRMTKRLPLSTDRDDDERFQRAAESIDEANTIEGTSVEVTDHTAAPMSRLDALEHQILDNAMDGETGEIMPPEKDTDLEFANDLIQQFQTVKTAHELAAITKNAAVASQINRLKKERMDLYDKVGAAYTQRESDFTQAA